MGRHGDNKNVILPASPYQVGEKLFFMMSEESAT